MGNARASVTVSNCTFTGNTAAQGGGMHNGYNAPTTVINSTFTNNTATQGGGMFISGSTTVGNCILWGDAATSSGSEIYDDFSDAVVSYSIVQGGYAKGTNITNSDPHFVDGAKGDLHLAAGSPAIDAGNGCATGVSMTDLEGHSRWDIAGTADTGSGLDLGAYEYQGTSGTDTLIAAFTCL
jgi:hypothetical protein